MATTEPAEPSEPAPRHRFLRRAVFGVVVLLVVLIGLLAFDTARSARTIVRAIKQGRSSLDNGAESVVVGDTAGALPQLRAAVAESLVAVNASNHPGMRLLGLLPVIGPNIRASRAVATAIGGSAQAGLTMADASKLLGWGNILIPGAKSVGDIDLAKIEAATPKVESVARQLQATLSQLQASGGGRLFGPVATGYKDVLIELQRRVALANDLKDVFHLLPTMLGGQGERRYLVAVQSLSIPRATGGLISSIGVLTADKGRLSLGPMTRASAAMEATNPTPDVPTDAVAMLRVAKKEGSGSLQGVIITDSVGLQDMLWMTGSVAPSDLHNPVTMDTAVDVLERRLFLRTDATKATTTAASVSGDMFRGFLDRRPSMEAFAMGMADAISQRHLIVWTTAGDEQGPLNDLGVTGTFDPKHPALAVIWRGTADNRAVSFLRRSTVQVVRIRSNGVAAMKTSVHLDSHAPKGPPSLLLGTKGKIGAWSGEATLYLPKTAVNVSQTATGGGRTSHRKSLGAEAVTGALSVNPGGSASFDVSYRQRKAATLAGGIWTYQLVILPQPSVSPNGVRIRIKIPDGMNIVSKANRLKLVSGALVYQGTPEAPLTLWVSYR